MRVAFLHPDLGIGGAERLVVDCALALQAAGHEVTVYTSHYDPVHSFDETRELRVVVLGNTLFPRAVFGRLSILCSILRQMHLTVQLLARRDPVDLFFVDQLSAAVPYLRTNFPKARVLFYCHHPDLVLASHASLLKRIYRFPFDWFEKWSTSLSDRVAVNSEYTRQIFISTFGRICDPSVLYPAVAPPPRLDLSDPQLQLVLEKLQPFIRQPKPKLFLSINRFERKKHVDLALEAFALLLHMHEQYRDCLMIVAGGYDTRVSENKAYLVELEALCAKFRVPCETFFPVQSWSTLKFDKVRVLFLPSVDSATKQLLLERADVLMYTPTNEHFGIVPLEAMQVGTPVLATNTGGPLETVLEGKTGWLRQPDMEDWYRVLTSIVQEDRTQLDAMAPACRGRAAQFSSKVLQTNLLRLVQKTRETERKHEGRVYVHVRNVTLFFVLVFILLIVLAFAGLQLLRFVVTVTLTL